MGKQLKFPQVGNTHPILKRSSGPTAEGVYGRENCAKLLEKNNRLQLALLHVAAICLSLYAAFWFQYVVQILYGMPSFYVLSGRVWYPPSVYFYLPCAQGLSGSLAESFMALSLLGSVLALFIAWHFTKGVGGKWRMRGIVVVFSGILNIWAVAGVLGEGDAWTYLEEYKHWLEMEIEGLDANRDYERSYLESRLESVDGQLILKPGSR